MGEPVGSVGESLKPCGLAQGIVNVLEVDFIDNFLSDWPLLPWHRAPEVQDNAKSCMITYTICMQLERVMIDDRLSPRAKRDPWRKCAIGCVQSRVRLAG